MKFLRHASLLDFKLFNVQFVKGGSIVISRSQENINISGKI